MECVARPSGPFAAASTQQGSMLARVALVVSLSLVGPAAAQLLDGPAPAPNAPQLGAADTIRFQVGAEITAARGACRDIKAMVAVPLETPEQDVQQVSEDFSRQVDKVKYRDLDGGARQMLITIPYLGAGETARAVVTFEVSTRTVEPPEDEVTRQLSLPRRPERAVRKFLTESPLIEKDNGQIRSLARDLWRQAGEQSGQGDDGEATDWQRVEYLYDYVLQNIQYSEGPDKSALNTLRDGKADCHGRSALFIALCRANKVPARVVWVNQHCYAEFYLEDAEGEGHWYPIESAGTRAFGGMPLARIILQKGDDFRVPERRGERLFYATDQLTAYPVGGSGKPRVQYIREVVD